MKKKLEKSYEDYLAGKEEGYLAGIKEGIKILLKCAQNKDDFNFLSNFIKENKEKIASYCYDFDYDEIIGE